MQHSGCACSFELHVLMHKVAANVLIIWLVFAYLFSCVQKKKPTSEKRKTNLELFKEELKMLVTSSFTE